MLVLLYLNVEGRRQFLLVQLSLNTEAVHGKHSLTYTDRLVAT